MTASMIDVKPTPNPTPSAILFDSFCKPMASSDLESEEVEVVGCNEDVDVELCCVVAVLNVDMAPVVLTLLAAALLDPLPLALALALTLALAVELELLSTQYACPPSPAAIICASSHTNVTSLM
ncbi:hypothetical protein H2198_006661 [Neophaeococcomyces mojaviensis]|uniref:Uncharacterized protein n=1 Tax=Neophaeococcomyces mojaviensis TaxID=3383035 RepID=A0ACC3A247_9EURO|nr:hypothetical protein H2198_006661 [Knufia sp. JES_112]